MSTQNDFTGTFDSAGPQIFSSQINANTVNFGHSAPTAKDKKGILLESLKYKNISTRWSSIREEHVYTCTWLLEETDFQDWVTHRKAQDNHGFLWIKGHPGSGKSTLMKYACLVTRKETKGKGITVVSFFFNARGASLEKSTAGLYRSLLWQLLKPQDLDFISQILDDVMLDDFFSETFSWTLESLESLFKAVIKELRRPVICFIDALDECDENQVRQMVSLFQQLGQIAIQHQIRFQVCFSSRHYPQISIRKAQELVLEGLSGHKQDIMKYIRDVLTIGTGASADEVKSEVQRKSGGVFMWVVLVVDLLNKEYDRGQMSALRRRLHEIPEKLSDLFQKILTRHCSNSEQVLLCLQWLLFTQEPLSPRQLYCAILAETDPDITMAAEQPTEVIKNFLLSSSKGLAEIVNSPPTVQFIHESVRDFLLKENGLQSLWRGLGQGCIGQSHDRLKRCCISYLAAFRAQNYPLGGSSYLREKPRISAGWQIDPARYPFLRYAADNILFHAETAAASNILQEEFLAEFDCLLWIILHNSFLTKNSRLHIAGTRLLYILAEVNASNLIKSYPPKYSYLEIGEERCGTPLFVALAAGSVESVQAFLGLRVEGLAAEHPARKYLQDYSLDRAKRTKTRWSVRFQRESKILSQLTEYREEAVLALFLCTAPPQDLLEYVTEIDAYGRTQLMIAAWGGQFATVEVLVGHPGIQLNQQCCQGMSALHYAVAAGHTGVIRLLLGKDGTDGRTPLSNAVEYGSDGVVKALLEHPQVKVDLRDADGRTPLSRATARGSLEVVKMLLETCQAEVDSRDSQGRTPFSWAVTGNRGDDAEAIRLLAHLLTMEHAEPAAKDNDSRSPFWYAVLHCDVGAIDFLLGTPEVDPNLRDIYGISPLQAAAKWGRTAIVAHLVNNDNIEIREGDWNPLAAERCPINYPSIYSDGDSIEQGKVCFQLIKAKWLARQATQTNMDQAKTDKSSTRTTRSRKRALSTKSDSLSVRSAKR